MCRAEYSIAVCPHCSNDKSYGNVSKNNLWKNEREVNVVFRRCAHALHHKWCCSNSFERRLIREIWVCRDHGGRDLRVVEPCTVHTPLEALRRMKGDKDKRDAELLKSEKRKAKKHSKVVFRRDIDSKTSWEKVADYDVLRELGIKWKANLEYDGTNCAALRWQAEAIDRSEKTRWAKYGKEDIELGTRRKHGDEAPPPYQP